MAYEIQVDSCQALVMRSLMHLRFSSGRDGYGIGPSLVVAGFQRRSLSAAGHAGRRGEGMGVRLSGCLFEMLWEDMEGSAAFHLLAIRAGD